MGKARGTEAKLARLKLLRDEPAGPTLIAELRNALGDKSNLLVAAAAEMVGERMVPELAPDLVAAFHRFLVDPAESDKLCRAKNAIVEALNRIEYDEEEVFRIAIRYVQPEPRWGGSDDAAAPLRGSAAYALVRINPRDLMFLLVDLLCDPEKVARSAAARALGGCGAMAALPLLRFKARSGDEEADVTVDCLSALMSAAPAESLPFVGQFLDSHIAEVAEGAALALAESRRPEALDLLKKRWRGLKSESLQNVLLLAIAITRLPAALEFLLEVVAKEPESVALEALGALAIHRHNEAVRERIEGVVTQRNSAGLRQKFAKEFRKEVGR
jgi:HEAT repeat protein